MDMIEIEPFNYKRRQKKPVRRGVQPTSTTCVDIYFIDVVVYTQNPPIHFAIIFHY